MKPRGETRPRRRLSPALVLFFLSPMTAELLTGSAPPAEFFNPFMLLVLTALYGSGAILIRELALRWRKGWPTILMLGAAYGIVEEGLMVKSFFDPQWVDLGPLGVYGRWAEVNWVWSLGLTLFHAVWSIGIPILLVTRMFPERATEAWVGRRMLRFLATLMALDVAFGFFALTPYRPPAIQYLLACLAVIALYFLARRLPAEIGAARRDESQEDRPRTKRRFVGGLLAAIAFFAVLWVIPSTGVRPVVTMVLLALLAIGCRHRPEVCWSRHPAGSTSVSLLWRAAPSLSSSSWRPLQQLDPAHAVERRGMALVGLAMACLLVWLAWRTRIAERGLTALPENDREG